MDPETVNDSALLEECVSLPEFSLLYRLIREFAGDGSPVFSYDIAVHKKVWCCDVEKIYVRGVSADFERARGIFETLVRNTVTPCTVYEILDDLL